MVVRVEFYGIPRSRAGVADTELEICAESISLAHIVRELAQRFPKFGAECSAHDCLAEPYVANVGGDRFVRDADTMIRDGETLLIMSADAGG